ncbi:MAG: hypothetical protein P8N76_20660 [Pirellulaceae bacterium]|nr:hypothetical protein [Pirellulaceae bacterium]
MHTKNILVVAALFCSFPAFSQVEAVEPNAQPVWTKQSPHELPAAVAPATLTITGNGQWFQVDVYAGDSPVISAYSPSGELLPDGIYEFDFKSIAVGNEANTLSSNSGSALLSRNSESPSQHVIGRFEVSGGSIVYR